MEDTPQYKIENIYTRTFWALRVVQCQSSWGITFVAPVVHDMAGPKFRRCIQCIDLAHSLIRS